MRCLYRFYDKYFLIIKRINGNRKIVMGASALVSINLLIQVEVNSMLQYDSIK